MRGGRLVAPLLAAASLALCLAPPALSRFVGAIPSGTKAFALDGRRFAVAGEAGDGMSLVLRELEKRGFRIDLPGDGGNGSLPALPFLRTALREEGEDKGGGPSLPGGLRGEHVLKMETDEGPVDLVFGKMEGPARSIRGRLRASGWTVHGEETAKGAVGLASTTRGKETRIVFLEEEGGFLLVRRVAR